VGHSTPWLGLSPSALNPSHLVPSSVAEVTFSRHCLYPVGPSSHYLYVSFLYIIFHSRYHLLLSFQKCLDPRAQHSLLSPPSPRSMRQQYLIPQAASPAGGWFAVAAHPRLFLLTWLVFFLTFFLMRSSFLLTHHEYLLVYHTVLIIPAFPLPI